MVPFITNRHTILDKLDKDLSVVHLDDPTLLLMKMRIVNVSSAQRC